MKKYIKWTVSLFMFVFICFGFSFDTYAGYVNGYYRSNGTYVSGYYRTSADGNPYNNYSYPGNYNPNTGSITGGSASTYLNNYYNNSSSPFSSSLYPTSYLYSGSSLGASPSSYEEVKGGYKSYGILFCDYNYYESGDKCIRAPKNSTASYSSFRCDYGYVKDGKECIELPDNAEKSGDSWKCGFGFNKVGKTCVAVENSYIKSDGISKYLSCNEGYVWRDDACYSYTQSCQLSYGRNSYGDKDYCYCSTGYEWNSDDTKCVQSKICPDNEVSVKGKCISLDESCQKIYGEYAVGVVGSKKSDNTGQCNCTIGYYWNNEGTSCVVKPEPILPSGCISKVGYSATSGISCDNTNLCSSGMKWDSSKTECISSSLQFGSNGEDVKKLQIKLAEKGLLTATPNGNFGPATLKAVKLFQANNGLLVDGIANSELIELINK